MSLEKFGYKVTDGKINSWMVKVGSMFSKQAKGIKAELKVVRDLNTDLATQELGVHFRDPTKAIIDMGYSLIKIKAVPNFVKSLQVL